MKYSRDFTDKNLSKLGDSIANLIFSLALSEYKGVPDGGRVPNSSLAAALHMAGLAHYVPPRTDKHGKGDIAEAIIAYAWLEKAITIEEASRILVGVFTPDVLHPTRKKDAIGIAFSALLKTIKKRLEL
ncbi:ribonuclease III family protein [Palaeococcus ferrophilus]|uniref:ribonuclease III family protein n=1 Tax=Palaeococcus ferrophilus TaxID=83868 RepID=UPI00064E388F|nr:ribonuclease III family protein [Palaeococcus ferrophilus]